jgi:3-methyladenine DNA glycosylase Mpg
LGDTWKTFRKKNAKKNLRNKKKTLLFFGYGRIYKYSTRRHDMTTIKSLNNNILGTLIATVYPYQILTIENKKFIVENNIEALKILNQYWDIDLDYDEVVYN